MLERLSKHYQDKLPFVCFRKPNDNKWTAYFASGDHIHTTRSYTEEGFVFAPFDDVHNAIVFLSSESEVYTEELPTTFSNSKNNQYQTIPVTSEQHIQLVNKAVSTINEGTFSKVVVSRKERLAIQEIDIIQVFTRLVEEYPNAFSYIWYHPRVGLWIGATPERLVSLEGNSFVTMALAGTQLYRGIENPKWGEKEKLEHQFVIDYIVDQIKDPTNGIILSDFEVSDTYTSKAGSLLHLKANIQGTIGEFNLKELLNTLHPTPAVCGLPKEPARQFILKNEHYNRSYYTGFLGEMNQNDRTELFVNLRCAEFDNNELNIYVGGGVTADSNAQKEWEETLAKTQTIKKAL